MPLSMVDGCITRLGLCMQGWLHSILYVLFENAMSVVKLWAVIAGTAVRILHCTLLCMHITAQKGIGQCVHGPYVPVWSPSLRDLGLLTGVQQGG